MNDERRRAKSLRRGSARGIPLAQKTEPKAPAVEHSHGRTTYYQTDGRIAYSRNRIARDSVGNIATDLLQRDRTGQSRRVLNPNQPVCLHPNQAVLPGSEAMVVGEHDPPGMVLEVDHTTGMRRGKLLQYKAWGFPGRIISRCKLGSRI